MTGDRTGEIADSRHPPRSYGCCHEHHRAPTGLHELAQRSSNGIAVTLLWARTTDTVSVHVHDESTEDDFEVEVRPGTSPLEVFTHPFAFAARQGIEYGGLRAAA